MKIKLLIFMALIFVSGLMACKSKQSTTTTVQNPQEITGKQWKLIEINGQTVDSKAFILLNQAESRISGTGGCNTLSGSFEQSAPARIRFSQVVVTQKACIATNYDNELAKVLEMTDNYSLSADGSRLSLNRARMAPLAVFGIEK